MRENYRLLKCDLHLHTHYSDNKDKMNVSQYCELAKKHDLQVLGIGDHHHNLTSEKWNALKEEIAGAADNGIWIMPGYEITFTNGHMVLAGKEVFDGAFIAESRQGLYDRNTIRIIAHPDNNSCQWTMNLIPCIDGIELVNGGQDIHCYEETSPCNGIKTYKEYLLLRHPISPFGQSDCHEALFFGHVWTGVWIPKDQPVHIKEIQDGIRSGNTFACFGKLEIEFYGDDKTIMGDMLWSDGNKKVYWSVPEDTEVTVYYGNMPVERYRGEENSYVPIMNGPYWILVQRGNEWAASAPIWIKGINQDLKQIRKNRLTLMENGIIKDLSRKTEKLLHAVKNLKEEKHISIPLDLYIIWLERFLIQHLPEEELVNKSIEQVFIENEKRLTLCIRILRQLVTDTLKQLQETQANTLQIYNLSGEKMDRIIKTRIMLPESVDTFYLVGEDEREIPFACIQDQKQREPVNEYRDPERMIEVIPWLERGEMHEFQIQNVELKEETDGIYVSFDLFLHELVEKKPYGKKKVKGLLHISPTRHPVDIISIQEP